jgi:hypothetical protein
MSPKIFEHNELKIKRASGTAYYILVITEVPLSTGKRYVLMNRSGKLQAHYKRTPLHEGIPIGPHSGCDSLEQALEEGKKIIQKKLSQPEPRRYVYLQPDERLEETAPGVYDLIQRKSA